MIVWNYKVTFTTRIKSTGKTHKQKNKETDTRKQVNAIWTLRTNAFSKITIKILEKGVKYV